MAEGATVSSFIRSIKNGIDISQSGEVSVEQAPRGTIWTKYIAMVVIWINVLMVNLEPIWDTLKFVFDFDLPEFPFTSLFDWLKDELLIAVEEFVQTQLAELSSIISILILLVIP